MRNTDVVRALLPLLILEYAQKKDFHGYELIQLFRREYRVYFGPSTIYPLLRSMVEAGLLEKGGWESGHKRPIILYKITHDGLSVIPTLEATLLMIVERVVNNKGTVRNEQPKRLTPFWVITFAPYWLCPHGKANVGEHQTLSQTNALSPIIAMLL